jgi:small subunit ribosomal protein S3
LRVGLSGNWLSKWYAPARDFGTVLIEDVRIRDMIKKRLQQAAVSKILIERVPTRIRVTITTARPGQVLGPRGDEVGKLSDLIHAMTGKEVYVQIEEVKRPEIEAQLVAENVVRQLEKRASFKRVIKRAAQTAMDFGAQGVRIIISGRLGGAEIARSETARMGKLPLHTLRADIDYGFAEAFTTYGTIGCKVWICRGEKLPAQAVQRSTPRLRRRPRGPRNNAGAQG